jgi:hypothetical protein
MNLHKLQNMFKDIIKFLEEQILECEPGTGCGRCDELRMHIETLKQYCMRSSDVKPDVFPSVYERIRDKWGDEPALGEMRKTLQSGKKSK